MTTELIVPTLGESVTEATVAKWFKAVGDSFEVDEPLVELETDKVTIEVPAPTGGTLQEIRAEEGAEVEVGGLLGIIGDGAAPAKAEKPAAAKEPSAEPEPAGEAEAPAETVDDSTDAGGEDAPLSPAVQRLIAENDLDPASIKASGKDGRLTKGDVLAHLEAKAAPPAAEKPAPAPEPAATKEPAAAPAAEAAPREERVRMTRLRKRIAERLKEAQNTAAMLTTFNEVDMSRVMAMRNAHKADFEKKHGVRLGFMSFFAKASIVALKELPAVNASIDGDVIVYKNHYDIGKNDRRARPQGARR